MNNLHLERLFYAHLHYFSDVVMRCCYAMLLCVYLMDGTWKKQCAAQLNLNCYTCSCLNSPSKLHNKTITT